MTWKRVLCWFGRHDWGMYWDGVGRGYRDQCVRCGKIKR